MSNPPPPPVFMHQPTEPGVAVTIAVITICLLLAAWIAYVNFGPPAGRRAKKSI